ncbi:MAG: metallophosphoesterase [Alphaproteobacteria bacterium]|nr:metallophosphoesterase [Alphaproteobacteria bacterium]
MTEPKEIQPGRRRFLKTFLGAGVLAGIGGGSYSFFVEPYLRKIKEYHLASPKWPAAHAPLKLAVASDFHVGCPSVDLNTLSAIVEELNALQADAILLLGDYLIAGVLLGKYVGPEPIAEIFSNLKAPLGVYSVLGNHDWWKDGKGMWRALENAGIKVLENDAVRVERPGHGAFWIAGLADDSTRTPDIQKTLQRTGTDDPVIMMSHDPAPFLEMTERPVVTLAGHTHGGQVSFPFIGPLVIPGRAPLRYAYGHIKEESKDMIVSCGIGTSILPVRFNRRPEVICLTITEAAT